MKYVFFHGNCYDGFGAAFAAWKKFGNDAKYIPVIYGKSKISDTDFQPEDVVYILDYSISNEEFESLSGRVSYVTMLDHHKTALERFTELSPYPDSKFSHLADNSYIFFDMNKSGALIAWEHFNNGPAPRLIQCISDRDLWQFKLPESKAIHAYLTSKKFDFEVWDVISAKSNGLDWYSIIDCGNLLLEQQSQTVDMICKKAYQTTFMGHIVPVVNASSHWSEVGNRLLELYPRTAFSASYCDQPDGTRMYSLRSTDVGEDVSKIALLFGGGGHRNAAGFNLPIELQVKDLLGEKEFKDENHS